MGATDLGQAAHFANDPVANPPLSEAEKLVKRIEGIAAGFAGQGEYQCKDIFNRLVEVGMITQEQLEDATLMAEVRTELATSPDPVNEPTNKYTVTTGTWELSATSPASAALSAEWTDELYDISWPDAPIPLP
jgi:hypothetical protein